MPPPNKPVTSAAIYTRISKDADGKGEGVERQEYECRQLAERLGLNVTAVYQDNDIGASNLSKKTRPQYEQMLADVRAGHVKMVLAYSNSRLTRRPREWIDLIELAGDKHKLQIRTVKSGDHDLSTADGRAVAITIAAWDAAEAERIAERSRSAHAAMARKGEPFKAGQRAFGWKEDRVTLEPVEANLIREAVIGVTNGEGLTRIANKWNERGVLTARGGKWSHTSISKLVANPRIAGIRVLNHEVVVDKDGNPVRGQWEAIVSPDEHETMLAAWTSRKKHQRKDKVRHFMGGLLVCGRCRGRMHGSHSDGNRTTYICREGHLGVSGHRLDEFVQVQVGLRMAKVYWYSITYPEKMQGDRGEETWEGEARLAELTSDIEAMMADYYESPRTRKPILAQVDELRVEADALSKERALWRAERKVEPVATDMPLNMGMEGWHSGFSLYSKQAITRMFLDEVMIKPTVRGRRNMEERVEFFWTRAATPWGNEEEPDVPDEDAAWYAEYERSRKSKHYKPTKNGSRSPRLPEVLAVLREQPTISVKGMAERVGLSDRHANKLMVYAKQKLANDPDFTPVESPTDVARKRMVELAQIMRAKPDVEGKEVCAQLSISSGHASRLMALVRKTLADDPTHDFSTSRPSTVDNRRNNKRIPKVIQLLQARPDLNGPTLASELGVGETYAQQLLKAAREVMAEAHSA